MHGDILPAYAAAAATATVYEVDGDVAGGPTHIAEPAGLLPAGAERARLE